MGELLSDLNKYLKMYGKYCVICRYDGGSARTCRGLTKEGFDDINVAGGMGSYLGTMRK